MSKAMYIMVGGFLGAGKTTAIGRLAKHLTDAGTSVGLITNDQGAGLVDTVSLKRSGYRVEEIAGGCFCCRFNSLLAAARNLDAESRPDAILAEPVGSCTDLVATVTYPLRRIYGDEFRIAPLSVVVDPLRAEKVLGLAAGRSFSSKVTYVYRKQLEEADLIVINKRDLLEDNRRLQLRDRLAEEFPRARIFEVSARLGEGLDEWFTCLTTEESRDGETLEIDYDTYAEGEALLGWLNATIDVASGAPEIDGNRLVEDFTAGLHARLGREAAEVAHLKLTLSPAEDAGSLPAMAGELAQIHLTRSDGSPEMAQRLSELIRGGQLIVNLRAESTPDVLRRVVESEVALFVESRGVDLRIEHLESFRPGRPEPTHRMTALP